MEKEVSSIRDIVYLMINRIDPDKVKDKRYADVINSYADVLTSRVINSIGDIFYAIIGDDLVSQHTNPPMGCNCQDCRYIAEVNEFKQSMRLKLETSLQISELEAGE